MTPRRRPRYVPAWLPPLVLALFARLALLPANAGLTMDSPLYVRMAEALVRGERGPSPAHHGYPLLVALAATVVPGREWPGRVVALLASLAVVALTYALARRRVAERWAALAAGVVALHPLAAVYGGAIMTEAPFLAVTLAGLLLVESSRAFAGGLLLGAAYWIRPEALVIAPLAALLAPGGWRARAHVAAGALAAALPYTAFLRWQQGWWSLTPKTALVAGRAAAAGEWRLADTTAVADTVGLAARLRGAGAATLAGWGPGLVKHGARLLEAWPLPLLVLSLAAFVRRDAWRAALAPLACLFVYPLLTAPDDVRFAHLFVPALALLAATAGAHAWARGRAWQGGAAALALAGAVLVAAGPLPRLVRGFDDGPMAVLRGAGAWLAAHSPADAVVMDRKAYVPFFAGRAHVQLPDDSLDAILDHAVASGADYLVAEEWVTATLRPQLAPLLDPARMPNEPRVRLVHLVRPAPGEGVAIFEVVR